MRNAEEYSICVRRRRYVCAPCFNTYLPAAARLIQETGAASPLILLLFNYLSLQPDDRAAACIWPVVFVW
jgi:hypothetical protein